MAAARKSSAEASTLRGVTRVDYRLLPEVSLLGLVSAQCHATEPAGGGCEHVEPTGRVGAGLRHKGFTAFVNFSRYERQPTLGELYGAGILVRGNAELRRELGVSGDVGARGVVSAGPLSVQAETSAFVRQATDLVAYARAAQGYVVPINVGSARVAGLELGVVARAFGHVELGCNATLLDPRDTTAGRRLQNDLLPFMSRLVLAPRVLVTTGDLTGLVLGRADLGADLGYLSSRFADAAGLIVIPSQTTLGITGAATWWRGILVTRLRVANVLDTQRFDIVGYPLPGRSLYASIEVHTP